jgi:hypothetical protein
VHPLSRASLLASRKGRRRGATGRKTYYLRRRAPMRRSVARSLFSLPFCFLSSSSTTAADYSLVDSSPSRPQQCTRARHVARRKAKVVFLRIRLQASLFLEWLVFSGVGASKRALRRRIPFFFLALPASLGPDRLASRSIPSLSSSQREKREHEERKGEQAQTGRGRQTPHHAPELFSRAFSET